MLGHFRRGGFPFIVSGLRDFSSLRTHSQPFPVYYGKSGVMLREKHYSTPDNVYDLA